MEPEVYCKYAALGRSFTRKLGEFPVKSNESISMIGPTLFVFGRWMCSATASATADVVRMTEGDASASTALTRSS
ncbi:Uncharacterised protein [Mycobacterium tuberculosis]|uniref:Uncharacterized protein n=1 Tax=Mycobacterium tuberculosis TaxID=1773 RepID=A0A654TEN7_MYCTX|nr:Uncharacterised protein [Mycobacterium tuberculosis]CFE80133.1 Uncharacterised protein [Mycobacterium tuberculosis]CFS39818.1 Uncharacterised protein [Mycobacterium tuberculosis]CKS94960.1 Uncharacterised protein [Mycobacterium tuberculosis]COW01331.1 Uncharacterised protein [Mycobacterium tuberculosis]